MLLFAAVLLYCPPAFAYIDPGTGSALVYLVAAVVLSVYFAVRGLYYRALEFLFRARTKSCKCCLALHSEDPRYEIVFLPVIRALARRGIEFTYFTMYERDESFEPLPPQASHQAIPPGLMGYSLLNHIEAKVLVTTTLQVDVMTFRRSPRVKHYCHIPHTLSEARYIRPFAYDYFDSVMCCGRLLRDNIRRIEAIRKLPAKQLFETGVPHYDELLSRASATSMSQRKDDRTTVLVAPSWGPLSLFQVMGTGFIEGMTERYRVVVRPHPQMKISQAAIYESLFKLPGIVIDTAPSPAEAMANADILVSDISGIAYEFAFIFERPVIVIDTDIGCGGFEGHLLKDTPRMKELCREFIVPLTKREMDDLFDHIESILARHSREKIVEKRNALIFNFGSAGDAAADQIEGLLKCL
jgi:hypothetical protein